MKEAFFNVIDLNKDKQICETDVFKSIYMIKTFSNAVILLDDLIIIMKFIKELRVKEHKEDMIELKKRQISDNTEYALTNKKLKEK